MKKNLGQFWDIAQVPTIDRKISQIKLWATYGIRKFLLFLATYLKTM
jgi:hypothetical protein